MNPGNYKLPQPCNTKEFKYKYVGYMLAGDEKIANSVFQSQDKDQDADDLNNSMQSNEKEIMEQN